MIHESRHRRGSVAVIVVSLSIALGIAGCARTQTGGSPGAPVDPGGGAGAQNSRVALYDSLDAMVADSSAIIVGTVTSQSPATDDGEEEGGVTGSTVDVEESFSPSGLASTLTGVEPSAPAAGESLVVRQFGAPGTITTAGPLLEVGTRYLLFLNPTMLPGDAAADFFVVGSAAGIYVADGDHFVRLVDDGDDLPATLKPDALT